jgi:hypothetical protein
VRVADDALPKLLPALRALHAWFSKTQTPYLVIGGVAVSLIARARATRDVDSVVLIDEDAWAAFLQSGAAFGFVPRNANPLEFAARSRVFLLVHEPSGTPVDISLGALPFEQESVARGTLASVGDVTLRVPAVEDLVIMKAVASRPQDLADIETLLTKYPKLNRRRVRRWIRDFAAILNSSEMVKRLESILARHAATSPGKRRRK